MIYPYLCIHCGHKFDVTKLVKNMDEPEKCPHCETLAERQFTTRVHLIGTKIIEAEYNPGLGMVIKNKRQKQYELAKRNLVEIGNDFGSSEKMQSSFETDRERQHEKSWEEV